MRKTTAKTPVARQALTLGPIVRSSADRQSTYRQRPRRTTAPGVTLVGVSAHGNTDADINITSGAADTNLMAMDPTQNYGTLADAGAQTRWNGVIGGGPLGSVDLSVTTGQYAGDRAIAEGTSAATACALTRWNGTGWDYHDATGAV